MIVVPLDHSGTEELLSPNDGDSSYDVIGQRIAHVWRHDDVSVSKPTSRLLR